MFDDLVGKFQIVGSSDIVMWHIGLHKPDVAIIVLGGGVSRELGTRFNLAHAMSPLD